MFEKIIPKVAAVLALAPTLAGANMPTQDGATQADPKWELGRGKTVHGITNILSGPAMAFYEKDAANFNQMFNNPAYKEFIKQHPEIAIDNPYADPKVVRALTEFKKALGSNPSLSRADAAEWDKRCELCANASAITFAHFVNINLVSNDKAPFDFGTSGGAMRGSQKGNWKDGTMGAFLKTPESETVKFRVQGLNGTVEEKSFKDLWEGWCRAQTADIKSKVMQPPLLAAPIAPGIVLNPPVATAPNYEVPGLNPRAPIKEGEKTCFTKVKVLDAEMFQGYVEKDGFNFGTAIFIPLKGGGGFHCNFPGCPGAGGV